MMFLWEKTLEDQLIKRRANYIQEGFITDQGSLPPVTGDVRGYYMDLQGNMRDLLATEGLWSVEWLREVLLTDAKLAFLISELSAVPKMSYEELRRREARFYRSDYLSASETAAHNTILEYIFTEEPLPDRKEAQS